MSWNPNVYKGLILLPKKICKKYFFSLTNLGWSIVLFRMVSCLPLYKEIIRFSDIKRVSTFVINHSGMFHPFGFFHYTDHKDPLIIYFYLLIYFIASLIAFMASAVWQRLSHILEFIWYLLDILVFTKVPQKLVKLK